MNDEFSPDKEKLKFSKLIWYFLGAVIAYVLLFEFIVPATDILPSPTLIAESLAPLWNNYNLFESFAITTSIIYIAIILGYLLVNIFAGSFIKVFTEFTEAVNGFRVFRYFPLFFAIILFVFWFNYSIFAEFFFALLVVLFSLSIKLFKNLTDVKNAYIDAAKGLNLKKGKIYSQVVWKNCQPNVFKELYSIHINLWLLTLAYEYISENGGFGTIFKMTLNYNDLAGLVALGLIITLLIWLGTAIIRFFENKLIFWEV
jgi:ABC-type nitrate/sulfonate/bicarbonate transport system permease component